VDTVIRFGSDEAGDPAVDRTLELLGERLGSSRVGRNERDPGLCFATVLAAEADWWAHVDAVAGFVEDHADLIGAFLSEGRGRRWWSIDVAVWAEDRAGGGPKSLLFPSEVLRVLAGEGVSLEVTVYDGPSPGGSGTGSYPPEPKG
jgi:hypothetical protein